MACSDSMKEYFNYLDSNINKEFELAQLSKAKGYDPVDHVEIKLAKIWQKE